ncbi:MAG: hypothetical protein ACC682_05710 [Gemmatimonadota bacterium]
MSKGHDIRAFDYVNQPYERVRTLLADSADEILRAATSAAASRAHDVASGLHVNLGGVEIGAEIAITVNDIEEQAGGALTTEKMQVHLEWEAAKTARLFPVMRGVLAVYPLTARETQLDFAGTYELPLGPIGSAIDAVIGHRIAEASVHRFVADIAGYLRSTLKQG